MKQWLGIEQKQQLRASPQMILAKRFLQNTAVELRSEIQTLLAANPLLEEAEIETDQEPDANEGMDTLQSQPGDTSMRLDSWTLEGHNPVNGSDESAFVGADPAENDTYGGFDSPAITGAKAPIPGQETDFTEYVSSPPSLREELLRQIDFLSLDHQIEVIALLIIDALDDDGYLDAEELREIPRICREEQDLQVNTSDIKEALCIVRKLDPVGVGARDLSECLLAQLGELPKTTPALKEAKLLLTRHKKLLEKQDYKRLRQQTDFSDETLQAALALLRTLNPKPGAHYATPEYSVPDVLVSKGSSGWEARLNPDSRPGLRINRESYELWRGALNSKRAAGPRSEADNADREKLQRLLQDADAAVNALEERDHTVLRVAREILLRQGGFMEQGPPAIKPLLQREIAEQLEIDPSTVSRAVRGKRMETPYGAFSFDIFFSQKVSGDQSQTSVRHRLQELIRAEPPERPHSDEKLMQLLAAEGVQIARRTVLKYREILGIPSSRERRRLPDSPSGA